MINAIASRHPIAGPHINAVMLQNFVKDSKNSLPKSEQPSPHGSTGIQLNRPRRTKPTPKIFAEFASQPGIK
jgi:hypothetical protein